jgi:uncharacterized membrane protein YkoI
VLEKFHRLGNFTVIDVKLAQRSANLLYVFKYIDGGGTVHKALLDARTGDVIR